MNRSHCPVLAAVVDRYEQTDRPVPESDITPVLRRDRAAIANRLARLADAELVCREGRGYRPTVTGREFLDTVFWEQFDGAKPEDG